MFAPADHAGERMRMIQHLVDVDYDRKTKLIASWRNPIAIFQKGPVPADQPDERQGRFRDHALG